MSKDPVNSQREMIKGQRSGLEGRMSLFNSSFYVSDFSDFFVVSPSLICQIYTFFFSSALGILHIQIKLYI